MTILNVQIDTEELSLNNWDFNTSLKDGITEELKKEIINSVSRESIKTITDLAAIEVKTGVEHKLATLLNEDVAFTDKWGKKTFVGSVEDYIKKTIDEKMLHPVDSHGKELSGCTASDQTWIKWKIEYCIKVAIGKLERTVQETAHSFMKEALTKELEQFKTRTLRTAIVEHLESIGVK